MKLTLLVLTVALAGINVEDAHGWKTPLTGFQDENPSADGTACTGILAGANLDLSMLIHAAGHGIHSITVRDIRYYFDPVFPEGNSIPTVNPDFDNTDETVLRYAPLGSDTGTPGMRVVDQIMSHGDNFMVGPGLSQLERIAHGMHMNELWQRTSLVYRQVEMNPPSPEVCSCVNDEKANGLLDHLGTISEILRSWPLTKFHYNFHYEDDKPSAEGSLKGWKAPLTKFHYNFKYEDDKPSADGTAKSTSHSSKTLPRLQDKESWGTWKIMLEESMLTEEEIRHFATYLYCKINTSL